MKHLRHGLVWACTLAAAAHSQSIDLKGVVRNRAGTSLAGVVVTQVGTGLRDTTDAQGSSESTAPPPE